MSCATHDQLASGEVDTAHADACLVCRRELAAQQAMRLQVAVLPAPRLDADRRRALAAEVMARADLHDDVREVSSRTRRVAIGGVVLGGVALAAAALLALFVHDEGAASSPGMARGASAVVDPRADAVARTATSNAATSNAATSNAATSNAATSNAATSNASTASNTSTASTAPIDVGPRVEPARKPKVDGSRQVFGATTDRHGQAIERDLLVEQSPVVAFRAGWEALRARRYDDAISAFDRATDPAVAEDAAFWAAIAAQRAGRSDDARKRLDAFLAEFPDSPRAESARRARESVR